jgi:hypothetical protein
MNMLQKNWKLEICEPSVSVGTGNQSLWGTTNKSKKKKHKVNDIKIYIRIPKTLKHIPIP